MKFKELCLKELQKEVESDIYRVIKVIMEICEEVHRELGGGFEEKVYQNALAVEFNAVRFNYLRETNIEIPYKGRYVGMARLDFIIRPSTIKWGNKKISLHEPLVLELKTVRELGEDHKRQLKVYLKSLVNASESILKQAKLGLLINFPKEDRKRIEFCVIKRVGS